MFESILLSQLWSFFIIVNMYDTTIYMLLRTLSLPVASDPVTIKTFVVTEISPSMIHTSDTT